MSVASLSNAGVSAETAEQIQGWKQKRMPSGKRSAISVISQCLEAVYVDDTLEAFSIREQLNKDTAVVHFEKANPTIDGLYQLVNNWFCAHRLNEFTWVNREQDLGIPGLRRAKLDYRSHHFVEKYVVRIL